MALSRYTLAIRDIEPQHISIWYRNDQKGSKLTEVMLNMLVATYFGSVFYQCGPFTLISGLLIYCKTVSYLQRFT